MSKTRKLKNQLHRTKRKLRLDALEPRLMMAVVEIFAAGQTNQESVELLIDNNPVASWSNIGGNTLANQFVTLAHAAPGTLSPDRVRIAFTNDVYDPANSIDRNVRIDAIAIDGVRFETESPNVYSTGTWRPEDGVTPGFRESEYLHANGYFQYSSQGGASGTLIEVRARGKRLSDGAEDGCGDLESWPP